MKVLLTYFSLFFILISFSQTQEERLEIIKNTNTENLLILKQKFNKEYLERENRVSKYLIENPNTKRVINNMDKTVEIYDIINNVIIYNTTDNSTSAITSRANKLYNGGGLGLNIQGQNMNAYIWDGGSARLSHIEFNNKVISGDASSTVSNHATHVVGTVVANGNTATLKGIAFNASAYSYDWNDDLTEMANEAANGMLVSNHSYGPAASVEWRFGAYDTTSRDFDQLAFNAPYYQAVTSSGNDRNDFSNTIIGTFLGTKGGYNLTRSMKNSKNMLTVGAVNQVTNYTGATSVEMSDFSNWGPSDDGRIKPDIVTKGVSVRSTTSSSDTSNGLLSGTSMAAPGITGTALLLQQYYKSLNPNYMRAATLKGLLLHTADEAGFNPGPDYEYGWGLANAEKAANIITIKPLLTSVIEENILNNSQTISKTIYATGTEPIMVSISWTDKEAVANTGTTDPTTLNIVNDLDLRVIQNSTTYFPWTLNPVSPWSAAVRTSDNFRDNFEKIEIDTPSAGIYTIQISHKNSLVGGSQNFSLIVSGVNQNLSNEDFNSNSLFVSIYPNPARDILNFTTTDNTSINNVSILDISGKVVLNSNNFNNNSVDISKLQSGVYFVKFSSDEKSIVKKFIKE